jgi:hypothetical protein
MVDMIVRGNRFSRAALALAALLLGQACGGDLGGIDPNEPVAPLAVEPSEFQPIPVAACARAPDDGLPADKRSLFSMIAALESRGYQIHQVSPAELTIYTKFRDLKGVIVAWRIRFGGDGAGEIGLPETMPPQPTGSAHRAREWGRGLAAAFDKLKCRPADELRKRCERAGFSF